MAPDYRDLPLDQIGLGQPVQTVLYAISLLPFVGLVIGANYMFRRNAATRQFGRRLLLYAVMLHIFYTFCVCPIALLWAFQQ